MNDSPQQYSSAEVSALYSALDPRDVEQFYRDYQFWYIQRQISQVQSQVDVLQGQLSENATRMQELHPSPIALSALAQLQAHGVNDIDLLDRMLERGEDWLDQTMQHLAYCEQYAILTNNNYTEWCEHALEGAYDWIDLQQVGYAPPLVPPGDASAQAQQITEDMLLQKLMSDEAEVALAGETETLMSEQIPPEQPEEKSEQVAPAALAAGVSGQPEPLTPAAEPAEEGAAALTVAQQEVAEATTEHPAEDEAPASQADPFQEQEQLPQPIPRWRKQGFIQWLSRVLRANAV
jgi:hypothetical protein